MKHSIIEELVFKHYGSNKYCKGPPPYKTEWPPLNNWRLTIMLSGSAEFVHGETSHEIQRGHAVIIPPMNQGTTNYKSETFSFLHFNFNLSDGCDLPKDTILHGVISPEILSLLKTYATRQNVDHYYAIEKLINILNYVILDILSIYSIGTTNKYVVDAIKYIDNNLTRQITLEEISKAVHISKDYLSHLFKTELGKPIIDYINEHKMNIIKSQILWSDTPLLDIARSFGYDNYSYFSRIFKRYIGKPPTSLRQQK
ncbi:MAG: helix-turn-helix transcriptional regulator [Clostridia bacterium]|nr:helix-turn-helix transcriptional regulator [Clostridia bacterium]